MADPKVKFFFLVAGFEYSAKALDFWKMCTGRVRERISFINKTLSGSDPLVSDDCTLRFLRFNVGTGKIEVIDKAFLAASGIKDTTVNEADWRPISSVGTGDAFDPDTFASKGPFRALDRSSDYLNLADEYPSLDQTTAKPDVMSIVDVYQSVRSAPPASVLELSFFSHGWVEGPILVNSNDTIHNGVLRDTSDKDGRAGLDFNLMMGVADGAVSAMHGMQFAGAFDPKGALQAWGCNFDIELRVVQQTQKAMRSARAAFTDDSVVNFEFEGWAPGRYQVVDPAAEFLPADSSQTTLSRKFSEVKTFLRKRVAASYAFNFASSMGRTGIGALPGTEGDDEKSGFHLMKVCSKVNMPECPVGFAGLFDFFDKQLGIHVSDRGYGVYDPATVKRVNADLGTTP